MNAGRSRNAEAQAALRARRRAHIDNLEQENDRLKKELDRSRSRATSLETINETLREELQTTKQMLAYDVGTSTRGGGGEANNERRLTLLVQSQRKTIKEMREVITRSRKELDVSSSYCQYDVDPACEEIDYGKRKRLSSHHNHSPDSIVRAIDVDATPAPPPSLSYSSNTSDDVVPETPYIEQWIPTQTYVPQTEVLQSFGGHQLTTTTTTSESHTSVEAMKLMLAQPQDFKHKVVSALLRDLLKDEASDLQLLTSKDRHDAAAAIAAPSHWSFASLPSASIFLFYILHLYVRKNSQVLG